MRRSGNPPPQERDYKEPEEVGMEKQIFCLPKWGKGMTDPMQEKQQCCYDQQGPWERCEEMIEGRRGAQRGRAVSTVVAPKRTSALGQTRTADGSGQHTWHQRAHEGRSRSEWTSRKDHWPCGMLAGGERSRKTLEDKRERKGRGGAK